MAIYPERLYQWGKTAKPPHNLDDQPFGHPNDGDDLDAELDQLYTNDADLEANKLARDGSQAMTGSLVIENEDPSLFLKGDSQQDGVAFSGSNGVTRFGMRRNSVPGHLEIYRNDGSGNYLDSPVVVNLLDGGVNFSQTPTSNGAPMLDAQNSPGAYGRTVVEDVFYGNYDYPTGDVTINAAVQLYDLNIHIDSTTTVHFPGLAKGGLMVFFRFDYFISAYENPVSLYFRDGNGKHMYHINVQAGMGEGVNNSRLVLCCFGPFWASL